MKEEDRPSKVIFVIITDGEENASQRYTSEDVKQRINTQQNTYKWEFVFLGANQDAFVEAGKMGINLSNAMSYATSRAGVKSTYGSLIENMVNYRTGNAISMCFNDNQRTEAMKQDNA